MKRTWQTCVAVVAALALGTVVSTASAEGGKRGSFSLGGKKVFSQGGQTGNQNASRTFTPKVVQSGNVTPKVQTFKPQILKGIGLSSGNGGTTLNPRLGKDLGIVTGNGNASGGTTLNPRLGKDFGIGTSNGGIIHKIPGLADKIGKVDPSGPIFDPGIGNGQPGGGGQQPGGNGKCNPGKGNCWFPPIIIGCGPNYGGCYPSYPCYPVGNCYPIYQTQPIVVQQPVVVAAAQAAVTEVKVAEKLLQVPVGSTVTLQGKELGDKPGQVLLVMEKLTLGTQLNEWKPDQVNVTLPLMGIGEPTLAVLVIVKPDGQVASSVKVELIPAAAPTSSPAEATAVAR